MESKQRKSEEYYQDTDLLDYRYGALPERLRGPLRLCWRFFQCRDRFARTFACVTSGGHAHTRNPPRADADGGILARASEWIGGYCMFGYKRKPSDIEEPRKQSFGKRGIVHQFPLYKGHFSE